MNDHARPKKPGRGRTVVLAALGINLVLGLLYAWGVIAKALVTEWNWTKTQAALPFTCATVAFSLMMIFAGRLQDKVGPRLVLSLGGVALGLGLALSSLVSTPVGMLLTFGLVGGIGIGLGYSATTPPALKWFPPSRKGVIAGVVVSGVGLAAVYISPLTEYLLGRVGISRSLLILGAAATLLVLLLAQLVSNPPPSFSPGESSQSESTPAKSKGAAIELDWHEMLRTLPFYQLWLMFVLAASAGLMIIAHVAIIGREQAGLQWGFLPIATLALCNTVGRILSGFLSDRIGCPLTMAVAFFAQAANMFLFSYYTTPALLIFGAAFTGLCYGTIFTLMPAATAEMYGVRNLGVNYGLVFTGFGVAGVVGPVLGGRIRDLSGSYSTSFAISGLLLLIGTVLALLMWRRQSAAVRKAGFPEAAPTSAARHHPPMS